MRLQDVVVTGASGFLGRAVIARLNQEGLQSRGVCRKPVAGMVQIADYCDTPSADLIIHLAEEPDRAVVNNSRASTAEHFDLVRRLGARAGKLIYASSGVVYGDNGRAPFKTVDPVSGYDVYSRLKLANEQIVLEGGGVVLRLANLYGPGMSASNVVSDIMRQIPGTGALRIRDDQPVRDFVAVEDAAHAFLLVTRLSGGGLFNIGSGIGTSTGEVARSALRAAGQEDRPVVATNPSGRYSVNVLDAKESQDRLGWRAASSLQDFFCQVCQSEVRVVEG